MSDEAKVPQLYTEVMVNRDFPEFNLRKGDTAMYIDYLESSTIEPGAILEIFDEQGESVDIATVPFSAIEPLPADQTP